MALLLPRLKRVAYNRLNPGSIYARPALAPFYSGMRGFGQARQYSNQQFTRTLQQWAVSPFAVNNQDYMERIRERYALPEDNTYELYGALGGVVGAGVGAGLSSGFIRSALKDIKFWKPTSWQNPFTTGPNALDGPTSKFRSYQEARFEQLRNYRANKPLVDNYNVEVKKLNKFFEDDFLLKEKLKGYNNDLVQNVRGIQTAKTAEDAAKASLKSAEELSKLKQEALQTAQDNYEKAKPLKRTSTARINAEEALVKAQKEALEASNDLAKAQNALTDAGKNLTAVTDTATKLATKADDIKDITNILSDSTRVVNSIRDTTRTINAASNVLDTAGVASTLTTVTSKAGKTVAKELTETSARFVPGLGLAADIYSLGTSAVGLTQSIQQGDIFNTAFNALAVVADTIALAGRMCLLITAH